MTGTWVCQAAPTALRPMAASGMYPLGLTAPMDRRHPRWSPGARGVSPRPRDRTGLALRDAHGTWYHILLSAALKEGKRSAAVDGQININSSFIIVNSIIIISLVAVAIPSFHFNVFIIVISTIIRNTTSSRITVNRSFARSRRSEFMIVARKCLLGGRAQQ